MWMACRWPRMCFPLCILCSPRHGLICFNLPQHEVRRPGASWSWWGSRDVFLRSCHLWFSILMVLQTQFPRKHLMKWVGIENSNAALHWSSHRVSSRPWEGQTCAGGTARCAAPGANGVQWDGSVHSLEDTLWKSSNWIAIRFPHDSALATIVDSAFALTYIYIYI